MRAGIGELTGTVLHGAHWVMLGLCWQNEPRQWLGGLWWVSAQLFAERPRAPLALRAPDVGGRCAGARSPRVRPWDSAAFSGGGEPVRVFHQSARPQPVLGLVSGTQHGIFCLS